MRTSIRHDGKTTDADAPSPGRSHAARVSHDAQCRLYESLPDGVLVIREGVILFANRAAVGLYGARDVSRLVGRAIDALLPTSQRALTRDLAHRLARSGRLEIFEVECTRLDGIGCVIEASVSATRFDGRHALQALLRDATARRLQHALLDRTRRLLEMMADAAPLDAMLNRLCAFTEDTLGGSARCGVQLLDPEGHRLLDVASGTLPAEFCEALHGIEVTAAAGAGGAAVSLDRRVITDDIATDPMWACHRELALSHGLRTCCATPIHDPDGRVAGVLVVYRDRPQRPGASELDVIEAYVRLAEEAIRRSRLRERMLHDRKRHESVLHAVGAAVLVFRGSWRLSGWNPGAQRLLGLGPKDMPDVDAHRLLAGAVNEDGEPLTPQDSPIDRCFLTRTPQRDRVIGLVGGDGRRRWVSVNVQPISSTPGDGDSDSVVCSLTDITAIKSAQQRLEQLARTDVLTGLPNRLFLQAEATRQVAAAQAEGGGVGMLVVDLNGFKHVNDTLGHAAGDALLIDVAQRLEEALSDGDLLARQGGDEFVVLTRRGTGPEATRAIGQRLIDALAAPFSIAGQEVFVSAAVGAGMYPLHAATPEALFRCADAAMYRAKRLGQSVVQLFGPELAAPRFNRISIEADLRHALQRDEFELHYQPRWRASDGRMAGLEALIRWRHPGRGLVSPADFVPVAEETGLIVPIGRWVLEQACRQHVAWRAAGFEPPSIAVNVSAGQFGTELFATTLPDMLARLDVPPSSIELEITETVMMRPLDEAEATAIERLRARGLRLMLDDFGTGYASLSYIQRFPLDGLKIDRSFVARLPQARDARAVVEAILSLSRSLGLNSIAEGVETEEQADWLRQAGCAELQGFLYARPMPASALTALLMRPPLAVAAG
jgi:diguanylate cyclase (GGDEF)-like protein/PAS domain S-box-containing protein